MNLEPRLLAQQKSPRFGAANPQRMNIEFWYHMVQTGLSANAARSEFHIEDDEEPVWCFQRFGPTRTPLADGTVVCIGGEHEAYYDPDFCIYNDVIVVGPDGSVLIYGFPEAIFPSTDFHTATLCGDRILIIGGLGYKGQRGGNETPVFSLDLKTYSISHLSPSGPSPGWIHKHWARLSPDGSSIQISGGEVLQISDGKERWIPNKDTFGLFLTSLAWRRIDPVPESPRLLELDWPASWKPIIDEGDADYQRRLLLNQVPPGHPLFAANVLALAQNDDDILFKLLDGSDRMVVVRLDFEPWSPHAVLPEPKTTFFANLDQWLQSMQGDSGKS